MSEHLDAFERARLARAEKTIRRGLRTFVAVGEALLEIRDNRLYRDGHDTFEAYCRAKWGLSKTHGNRLVQAAQVVHELAPVGVTPSSERQARELAPLLDRPGLMRRTWGAVVHRTGGKPTAKDVREVVHQTINETPARPDAAPEAPDRAGGDVPAAARGEARTAGTSPSKPPAGATAGEGGGPARRGQTPGRSASGAPADADREPRAGAPTDPRPEPQPVSPSRGPESGGTGAPSMRSLMEGAVGASPSAAPVAEGEGAWVEPLLTRSEVHDALTDQSSPLFLPDFGCRLALVHAAAGAPLDRAVAGAFRQSLGVA